LLAALLPVILFCHHFPKSFARKRFAQSTNITPLRIAGLKLGAQSTQNLSSALRYGISYDTVWKL
jgi:hypothetical protein